ncbi:MAG: zf-HC2 domain-containing protein [Kiritimatiellaeota bacterium]|nr:zf-HC2 domain-containing protein [Kiritimatiellota bacterium]
MSERNDSLSGPEDLLARERDDTLPWAGLPALRKLERSALPHGGTQDPIAARACAWRVELTAYLQDELPAAGRARVAAHVSECAGCAALLEAFRGTLEKLEPAAVEAPAPDLAPAILARLAEDDARVAV